MRTLGLLLLCSAGLFAAAPTITSVSAVSNSPTTITVTWTTNISADSCVGASTTSGSGYVYPGGSATSTLCVQDKAAYAGLVTSHSYTIWGLTSNTLYYLVPVSTDGSGNSTTGAQVSATTLTAPATLALAFSLGGGTTKYNDQYHGLNGITSTGNYENGDTHHFAWADDGNIYSTQNDTDTGVNGNEASGHVQSCANFGRDIAVTTFTSQNLMTEATTNSMDDYGNEDCQNTNGWSDGDTWKTGGIASVNGSLYLTLYRQQAGSPFAGLNSLLLKSTDHGVHWCNPGHATISGCSSSSTTGDAPGPGGQMWTATTMRAPTIIPYCQDNSSCSSPLDNSNVWTYLTTVDSSDDGINYLLRVKTSLLPRLNAADYYYFTGGDGNLDANWSATVSAAVAIPGFSNSSTSGTTTMYYIPTFKRYVYITWAAEWTYYEAAHPWGPFTPVYVSGIQGKQLVFPALVMQTLTNYTGYSTVTLAGGGSYLFKTAVQDTNGYSLYYQTLMVTTQPSSTAVPYKNPFHATNLGDGPNDIVPRGIISFYEMGPETSGSITDQSGTVTGAGEVSGGTAYGTFDTGDLPVANSTFAGAGATYHIYTPYLAPTTDFTFFVVAKHWNFAAPTSAGGPLNDFVSNASNFNMARMSATGSCATTGTIPDYFCASIDTSISAGSITSVPFQMTDGAWQLWVVRRIGSAVTIYDASKFDSTATALTALASGTASGNLPSNAMTLGANWKGSIALFGAYNVGLTDFELRQNVAAIRKRMVSHKIYLPAPKGSGYPLDNQPPPMSAYSVRRLLTKYTGQAMNVRRASDSATTDIPFNGSGDIDTSGGGTLMTFCASTSCYVTKWYDQSGNGYDLSQSSTALQPTVVSSGTAITLGGHLSSSWTSATGQKLTNFGTSFHLYGAQAAAMAVGSLTTGGNYMGLCRLNGYSDKGVGSGTDQQSVSMISSNATNLTLTTYRNSDTAPTAQTVTSAAAFSAFSEYDGYNIRFRLNGTENLSTSNIAQLFNYFDAIELQIGSWNGDFSELIQWNTGLASTTVATIRATHVSYFGTP